ncbi:unnamed protein product [Alternaria alternata]|jgi:hypothetical protein|nr:hypothetical protein AALT_g8598 [Alternaria alternata]
MENPRQVKTGERPTAQLDTLAPLIRQCLEEMSNTQTLLSSTRKELLIERERIKTAGREVRQKRDEAGNAEVGFMNCVRDFVNSHLEQLPTTLLNAYEKVERTRDNLGVAEENYLQAERTLAGAEWTFMNREDRFYQFDINRILFETHSERSIPLYSQPSEATSHPPIHHLPPCPVGSLSPDQVSKLPPPPPPPLTAVLPPTRLSLYPCAPMILPSSASINGRHVAVLEGVSALKKELGQLWQRESDESVWAQGDEALFAEGTGILDTDMTASRSEHSDILLDVLRRGEKAEPLDTEDMGLALEAPALARRFSDSTYSSRAVPRLPVPMRRAQTESAALFNRCSSDITKKIEEWSLTHLKGSVIQKRLYLNTLQDNGLEGSIGSGLEDLATEFWSKDSLNHTRDSNELHAAFANGTEYETQSLRDQSVTRSIAPSLLMQHRLEGNLQSTEQMKAELRSIRLQEMMEKSGQDTSQTVPLSSSPSPSLDDQTSDELGCNDRNKTPDPAVGVLCDQRNLLKDSHSSDVVVNQPKCTCLAEFGDAAQRKDSVQSTHHPECEMAAKHGGHITAYRSSRERIDVESITKATTLDGRCSRTRPNHSVDLKVQHASKSDYGSNTRTQPDFDIYAQASSVLPTTITKENVQFTASPTMAHSKPVPGARRNSIAWVRRLFPQFKYKRSKSSPSIGDYHSAAHA